MFLCKTFRFLTVINWYCLRPIWHVNGAALLCCFSKQINRIRIFLKRRIARTSWDIARTWLEPRVYRREGVFLRNEKIANMRLVRHELCRTLELNFRLSSWVKILLESVVCYRVFLVTTVRRHCAPHWQSQMRASGHCTGSGRLTQRKLPGILFCFSLDLGDLCCTV